MPRLQRQGLTFEDRDGKAEIALPYLHEHHQVNIVYTVLYGRQLHSLAWVFLGLGRGESNSLKFVKLITTADTSFEDFGFIIGFEEKINIICHLLA